MEVVRVYVKARYECSKQFTTHTLGFYRKSSVRASKRMDAGSSVTLIFYKVGEKWWREPILNIIAAAAQMSQFTHVEIALGGKLQIF